MSAAAIFFPKSDEVRGEFGLDRVESFEALYDAYDASRHPAVNEHFKNGIELAALLLLLQLLVDLLGQADDILADLRCVGPHVHGDFSQAGSQVGVLKLGAVCKHFSGEVEGQTLIHAEGDALILLAVLDLDEAVLLIDVDVLFQFIHIPADGRAMDSQSTCYIRSSESFWMGM